MVSFSTMKDQSIICLGHHLDGKKVALLVTGSIAAYKTPSLVRHFRQYGAEVQVYLTGEAKKYVTETSLGWASTRTVITELSARAEHLYEFDAYVVAPATLNTIGQMADGKASNAVTNTLASALGRLVSRETSVLVAPAMHETLDQNPAYQQNLKRLESFGVRIIKPEYRQGKAHLADIHSIVAKTIRELSRSSLKGKQILVTAGPTPGRIDSVRALTNRFRGRLGIQIAEEGYMRGADIKLILGPSGLRPPVYMDTILIRDFYDYHSKVNDVLEKNAVEIGIFSAAVADYIPEKVFEGKIPSGGKLKSIKLKQTPKIVKEVRRKFPKLYMVTFKYEERVSREKLEKIAQNRISQGYQMVIANRGEDMSSKGEYRCIIVNENGVVAEPSSKRECARLLFDLLEHLYC